MHQYKISEESYNKFRKKWFVIGIPVISAMAAIGIMIAVYSQGDQGGFNPMPYVIPIMAVIISFSIFRGLKKQKRLLMSYSLTISDSDITREQLNTAPLTINFMEIKEILKAKKGGFMIKGRTRTDVIYVPYLIDDAAALEEELGKFAPITGYAREARKKGVRLALTVLTLAAFLTLILTNNKLLVIISGVMVSAAFIYRFIERLNNKNMPTNLKRGSWTLLIAVAFVIYTMYVKLTGQGY